MQWKENLERLVIWREENPGKWPEKRKPGEKEIGLWIDLQRVYRKRLYMGETSPKRLCGMNPERVAELDERLPGWYFGRWETILLELEQWRKQNPNAWPKKSGNRVEKKLNKWWTRQRSNFNRLIRGEAADLDDERVAILNQRLPGWNEKRDTFTENLDSLVSWRNMNSEKWPSVTSTDPVEKQLATWLNQQLVYKRKMDKGQKKNLRGMSQDRVDQLDLKLPGWASFSNDACWKDTLEKLVKFRTQHPEKWPNSNSNNSDEKSLGKWLTEQRGNMRNSRLAQERIEMLNEKCPGWFPEDRDDAWTKKLMNVIEFTKQEKRMPGGGESASAEEKKMNRWLNHQKVYGRKLREGGHTKLGGMNQKRLSLLDAYFPGWK